MQLGATLPCGDIGTSAAIVRDYAQAMEGMGIEYLQAPDHVLGGNPAKVQPGQRVGTTETAYHDPFVLFSFVAACTKSIGFVPGVLILAQRQAALVAKQAASLDALVPGRLRLGVGVGWNELEFIGLNESFGNRGRRSEEQVQVMQALWSRQHVTFKGKYHTLDDYGINPRPPSGRVPIWFGGHAEATFQRAAKYGDGFMPLAYAPDDSAAQALAKLRGLMKDAGRDPSQMGIEVWCSPGKGTPEDWRKEVSFWKSQGVTHITAHTTYVSKNHVRIKGRSAVEHIAAVTRFQDAVKDLL